MNAILGQIMLGVRLNFRNRKALIYGYLFPAIFLAAFRTLYREERVPLLLHAGELLTVTILGGACFGLPTGIVSDRDLGVWRRYRMLPASSLSILAGTLVTRYLLLLTAGMLQIALAMACGMPAPRAPLELFAAFTVAAIAFMGIGLDIAMLAGNVPAVQALGQCIFLPMLIIGGVAVPLSNLPAWAQRVSDFLPGRYSVGILQAGITGAAMTRQDLIALLFIAAAGMVAGVLAFRWDPKQRPSAWLAFALCGWMAAGFAAAPRNQPHLETAQREERLPATEFVPPTAAPVPAPTPAQVPLAPSPVARQKADQPIGPARWEDVSKSDIDGVAFNRLPSDTGVVAPIAALDEEPEDAIAGQLDRVAEALPGWKPAKAADPVQRVRNYLYAAAVADVYRMDPLERFVPRIVFRQMEVSFPEADLPKLLYYVAVRPDEGSDEAAQQLHEAGLPDGPVDTRTLRNRAMIYAFKLLGRLAK